MGLYYPYIQSSVTLLGSKNANTGALTPVALTANYADNRATLTTGGFPKLNVNFQYTTGAGETNNSLDILFEQSDDRINWFGITNESVSAGTSTITNRTFNFANATAATALRSSIGLDVFYNFVRVSFKENGIATNAGTIYAESNNIGM